MTESNIENGKQLVHELAKILRSLTDEDVGKLLDYPAIDELLSSILDRSEASKFDSVIRFLLANKTRASLLANIRYLITNRYSFYGEQGGQKGYCSPDRNQWFEDGVMVLSGKEPFSGFIGLFHENEMKYAMAARDINPNEEVTKGDLEFLSISEFEQRFKAIPPEQISDLDKPIRELQELLDGNNNDESQYQEWLQKYPWILGVQYDLVEGHRRFDDENIPDFTGRKVHDGTRDVIEIKPPFVKLFNNDGSFSGKFLADWSQTKRYLNFANEEKDYLRRKGLVFENPRGYLITGLNLSEGERRKLRIEERYTPAAQILTYDELVGYAAHTVNFVKQLQQKKDEEIRSVHTQMGQLRQEVEQAAVLLDDKSAELEYVKTKVDECPVCEAPLSEMANIELDKHTDGTIKSYACGFSELEGDIQSLCPSDPKYPKLEDFELVTHYSEQSGQWYCQPKPKTAMARKLHLMVEPGSTEEEAKERVVKRYNWWIDYNKKRMW